MALFTMEDLSFSYPEAGRKALDTINIDIEEGEFISLIGRSGSGKSTFLKHLKPSLRPFGKRQGQTYYRGRKIEEIDGLDDVKIGYVFQNPDNQIVTDKVWHELAFSLENLGYDQDFIRLRVAEMASFFGIHNWFHKDTGQLSGGEKQILNLASVMAMDPDILLLDEPTSQLDPIASREFLDILARINQELGTSVVLSEHRLEDILLMSDRLLVMEEGRLVYQGPVRESQKLMAGREIFKSYPTAMRLSQALGQGHSPALTVKEARSLLENFSLDQEVLEEEEEAGENILEVKNCYFKYKRKGDYVLEDLNLAIEEETIHSILGGNGTGKSTCLYLMGQVYKPLSGSVRKKEGKKLLVLPQDPQLSFRGKTLREELEDFKDQEEVHRMMDFMELGELWDQHPYDLSGGEQQKLALGKLLLKDPDILLLDEVTKGLDGGFKDKLGQLFLDLKDQGKTIVMVSHDIEFCAKYSDRASLFFNGQVIVSQARRKFFTSNNFYTSKANRIARNYNPSLITLEEVVAACKK